MPNGVDLWDWGELAAVALHEARRVLGDRHDSEDAAQEAIIRAYRARRRCLTPEAPSGWVRAIARREALRILAARRTQAARDGARWAAEDPQAPGGVLADLSDTIVERLTAHTILVQIPAGERALLVRRYLFEHSSAQIAADLQLPASTVRVRLHRALERFREHHLPDP